jgi:hypothetical protein
MGCPGLQILMLSYKDFYVTSINFFTSSWTVSPTRAITDVSPKKLNFLTQTMYSIYKDSNV